MVPNGVLNVIESKGAFHLYRLLRNLTFDFRLQLKSMLECLTNFTCSIGVGLSEGDDTFTV